MVTHTKEIAQLADRVISMKNGKIIKEIQFGGAFQGELDYDTWQGESGGTVRYSIPVTDVYVSTRFADKHRTKFMFRVNPARHLDYGSYFPGILQDVYVSTHPTEHTRLLIGNSRTPVGMEGGQSSYTLPLVYRSQIARTYGGFRAFGAKLTGDYKWFDYNVGIYDSSRYFYDMFKGAEFTGWVDFKPLANLDEEKYGSLKIGTGYNCGKRYNSYSVWSTGLEYQYKNLITRENLPTSATLQNIGDRKPVQVAATVTSYSRRRTKTGKEMITINASDSYGNVDAVAFGDSAIEFANILSNDTLVLLSGKTSCRDDSVSIFVDSITPLSQWVANVAKKITLDIWDKNALGAIKKALSVLPAGHTKVVLNLHGKDKTAAMALPGGVLLNKSTIGDIVALGIKVKVE